MAAPVTLPSPQIIMRLQVASEFFIDFDKRNKELLAAFFFPKVQHYSFSGLDI